MGSFRGTAVGAASGLVAATECAVASHAVAKWWAVTAHSASTVQAWKVEPHRGYRCWVISSRKLVTNSSGIGVSHVVGDHFQDRANPAALAISPIRRLVRVVLGKLRPD